ncbi:acyl-CoA dehydrogenase [Mangrovimicrobium sediminis]|uniref:Acyl-CoA dehydrogenase n=1 Tax=Mangrovimicrobium sediminis TaxID=2562682 RepID=A0A4Z0LVW7_9GAMM|nr:acyl-CoA dehydrogenase family protein [Haliea sp. SAOS-164]TGD71286.1 acyl-CoA dehydrogenase [Haliea sp. SAOS-164]
MDFTFTDEQCLFRDAARDFLRGEIKTQRIRESWNTDSGRDTALWRQLAEIGLTGVTVPEAHGGLGLDELDFVQLAQECGYVALPEPLVNCALVAVPLLVAVGDELAAHWLPKVAAGEARVIAGLAQDPLVEDAHVADLLLYGEGGNLYALQPDEYALVRSESVDPSRRLFRVTPNPGVAAVLDGAQAEPLLAAGFERGALGCAAQALGLAQRMLDMSVEYTAQREQFGRPIGSFQAVKHHLADVAVALEYARAPVYRAACSLARGDPRAPLHVAHAKLAACDAASLAATKSIQVHGAMGYTWEVDLHIFMKKAWALAGSWGDAASHKARIAEAVLDDGAPLGAGATF